MALNVQKWRFFRTFFNIVCTFLEYEGVENQIFSRNITNFLSILAPEIEFSSSWNYKPPKNMRQRLLKSQWWTRNKLKTIENWSEITDIKGNYFSVFGRHGHWKKTKRRRRAGSQWPNGSPKSRRFWNSILA